MEQFGGENDLDELQGDDYWDDIDDDDTLSSDSLDFDGTDNWPLHADCKYELTLAGKEAWVLSPRSLKNLSALKVVKHGLVVCRVSPSEIPINLYRTLFVEACRCKCEETIASLVSSWPQTVLDLRDVEIPLDCYRGYYTKAVGTDRSLAAMVISGLLRIQPESKLSRVLLPESEAEGAALTKLFLQLPAMVLRDVPYEVKHQWLTEYTLIADVAGQLRASDLPTFELHSFTREKARPITIVLPGVVQWIGRSCNHLDVLLGLALSAHTPFVYQFERISVCNARSLDVVRDILKMVPQPELLRRLLFISRSDAMYHAASYLGNLSTYLQRFTNIESFICTTNGLFLINALPGSEVRTMYKNIAGLFSKWNNLQEVDLAGNYLASCVGKMLTALEKPLKRLNLSAMALTKSDILHLANSHHAPVLVNLNLDHNNLHKLREPTKCLFQNLSSIVSLRTCNCLLDYQDSLALASALSHSQTLKTWNLLQNNVSNLSQLKHFVHYCSQIPSLKEVGCKPVEIHACFAGLYVPNMGPVSLSDEERHEILALAEKLNLLVF